MDSISQIYTKKYHIDLRDVDFNKKVKLSTLFSFFQDIASMDSDHLGYGIETLDQQFGVAWILTRIRVEIIKRPDWNEEITVETWPLKPGKVEFDRDYLIKDKNGEVIIKAISKWVLMDIKERKVRRSEFIGFQYPEIMKERAIDCPLGKLKHSGKLEVAYNKVIGYSDIDFNGHLNNSKYVDYIMDCFHVRDHQNYTIHAIDLHFNHEAMPGDTITLYKDTSKVDEHVIYIEGQNIQTNQTVFKSQVDISEQ